MSADTKHIEMCIKSQRSKFAAPIIANAAAIELATLRDAVDEARRIIKYYAHDDPEPAEAWLREHPEG